MKRLGIIILVGLTLTAVGCAPKKSDVVIIDDKNSVIVKEGTKEASADGSSENEKSDSETSEVVEQETVLELVEEKTAEEQEKSVNAFNELAKQDVLSTELAKSFHESVQGLSKENSLELFLAYEKKLYEDTGKLHEILFGYSEALYDYDIDEMQADPSIIDKEELRNYVQSLIDSNYRIVMDEGMFYLVVNYEAFDKYQLYFSEDIKDYITFKAFNTSKPSTSDNSLIIPVDEVRERLLVGDKFLADHKDSVKYRELSIEYMNYFDRYIYGDNNAPAFGFEDNKLREDVLESYKKIDLEKENSILAGLFKEYMVELEKFDYIMSDEFSKYRNSVSEGLMEMFGIGYEDRY